MATRKSEFVSNCWLVNGDANGVTFVDDTGVEQIGDVRGSCALNENDVRILAKQPRREIAVPYTNLVRTKSGKRFDAVAVVFPRPVIA